MDAAKRRDEVWKRDEGDPAHRRSGARRRLAEPTGPAGIGAVLRSESGEVIGEIAKSIGVATNNVAEYTAMIEGLQMALDRGVTDLDAYIDSPVVAGHLLKGHKVQADHLRPLVDEYVSSLIFSRPRRSLACPER